MRSTMSRNSNERRKQGFILMEMLIVVAVIAVLIAVAIPVFSSSLHKSRVATDWANVRTAYAQLQMELVNGEVDPDYDPINIGTVYTSVKIDGEPVKLKEGICYIIYSEGDQRRGTHYEIVYGCNKSHPDCMLQLGIES